MEVHDNGLPAERRWIEKLEKEAVRIRIRKTYLKDHANQDFA